MERWTPVMRWLVLVACVLCVARTASADAYSYGGSGQRFRLSVMKLGFNEGAGIGGWDEDSAREFAGWAARFDAVIPKGAFVELVKDLEDDDTVLKLRMKGRTELQRFPGDPELDAALRWVAQRFHRPVPKARRARLFTLQVFASRSERGAARFVEQLDSRGIHASRAVYHAACHPCSIPEARVLTTPNAKVHRVILGVFADRHTARLALLELERFRVRGFVRELL